MYEDDVSRSVLFKSDKKRLNAGKEHCRAPANLFPEELCKESVHCSLTVLTPHCERTKDREWGWRGGGSLLLTASPVSGPEGDRGAHSVGGGGCGWLYPLSKEGGVCAARAAHEGFSRVRSSVFENPCGSRGYTAAAAAAHILISSFTCHHLTMPQI